MLPVGQAEPLSRAAAAINNQGILMPLHTELMLTCIVDDVGEVGEVGGQGEEEQSDGHVGLLRWIPSSNEVKRNKYDVAHMWQRSMSLHGAVLDR